MTAGELSLLESLFEAARAGDEQTAKQVSVLISKIVTRLVKSRIYNQTDAQDLIQEVMLAFVQNRDHLLAYQLPGWITHTVRHKVVDHIRRTKRDERLFEPYSEAVLSVPDKHSARPEVIYEAKELESFVERLGPTLTPRQQQVFALLLDEVSEQELRERCGRISPGALHARVYRLRRKVERECKKTGYVREQNQSNSSATKRHKKLKRLKIED
jgi:RNA polymerase sigma factor (sigma-70 family)